MARVLVVDDENLMRTMVEVACRRLGHEALCAATLAEGRRLAAAGVDVILLDMLLPDGNGLDAQQELAALPDAPDIVVITGHGDGDAAEKALRGGVWDFLMKPVRVRDVEETLSHVLEARDRRRSRRGLELEPGQVAGSGPAMQAALAQRCQSEGVRLIVVLPPMADNVRTEVCDVFGITETMQGTVLPTLAAWADECGFTLLDYEWGGSVITDDDKQFFDGFHLDERYGLPEWTQELFGDIAR